MQQPPTINNGKKPDEPYNAVLGFWLPSESPYGNFQLKQMKLSGRIDELNRKIAESFSYWDACHSQQMLPVGYLERHTLLNEEIIYHMRRIFDELISLIWCLEQHQSSGVWPSEIVTDSIGRAMKVLSEEPTKLKLFSSYVDLMKTLNSVSNAYKHSFVNTDYNVIGRDEPCVHALDLKNNKLESAPKFYSISLGVLVNDFDDMYQDAMAWLKAYSVQNLPKP